MVAQCGIPLAHVVWVLGSGSLRGGPAHLTWSLTLTREDDDSESAPHSHPTRT